MYHLIHSKYNISINDSAMLKPFYDNDLKCRNVGMHLREQMSRCQTYNGSILNLCERVCLWIIATFGLKAYKLLILNF